MGVYVVDVEPATITTYRYPVRRRDQTGGLGVSQQCHFVHYPSRCRTGNLVGNKDSSVPTTRPLQLPDPLAAFLTHALPRANFPSHPGRRGNKSSVLVSVREIFANSDMRTSSQPVQVGTANNFFLVPRISNQYNQPFRVRSRKFRKCRTSRTSATLQRETALIASQRLLNPNGTPKAGGTMRVIVVNNASSMEGGCRSLHTECFYMLQQARARTCTQGFTPLS